MDNNEIWTASLCEELAFWERYFDTKGLDWPEDFIQRMDQDSPLPEYLVSLLPPDKTEIKILDVGSGPISKLGFKVCGRRIQLTAVDPLADEYNRLLDTKGIVPRTRTQRGEGERLLAIFERDSFDIVHAQNSLDHSHNPFQAIQQMLAVVKPSGYVRLEHAANEGQRQNYQGLHQWNLDVRNGQLIVWNLKTAINISEELRDVVTSCWADEMCCSATLRKTE